MAKESKKFNKKLALTVALPALVMAVIIAVIGVSFAWFNDSVSAEIATIHLSVADSFVMDFVLSENSDSGKYLGQTGYNYETGMLITNVDNVDKPFIAPFSLRLDTVGYEVSFNCAIVKVEIFHEDKAEEDPNKISTDVISDIELGFTWYITETTPEHWYTPYGTVRLNPSQGLPSNNAFGSLDLSEKVSNSGFIATASQVDTTLCNFVFNIVFAPEKLFWQQYCAGDPKPAFHEDLYGDENVDGGFRSPKWDAINKYSLQTYSGYTYKFSVELTVDSGSL